MPGADNTLFLRVGFRKSPQKRAEARQKKALRDGRA